MRSDTIDTTLFIKTVRAYYTQNKRSFPWRNTTNPYRILVSEIMLQQTQTDRVVPKYCTFLKRFPTITALAEAPLRDVLALWQGLGYNRRAQMLHNAARIITKEYGGRVPCDPCVLQTLPGIGPYTARAVCTFAYNIPVVFIETNIRSVFIHHFFNERTDVDDKEILPLIEKTLDTENPREWYAALMDYGAFLKKEEVNPNRKSRHYSRQSPFKGSRREKRGAIIRLLSNTTYLSLNEIARHLFLDIESTKDIISKLCREGLLKEKNGKFSIV